MSREQILAKLDSLVSSPIAIEALWDGDSDGWFVCLTAITADSQRYPLGTLSDGGNIRHVNGQVPPWPEAVAASQLGKGFSEQFGAKFYFPSPNHPENDCPFWHDRKKGYPCRRCGILLLQRHDCRWQGICYHCHLDEETEQRESKWTPEQRSGARCHICGNPAANELNGAPACAECSDKYVVYTCVKCNGVTTIFRSVPHGSLCSRCELNKAIESLTESQRHTILDAIAKGRRDGVWSAIEVMDCSLYDAQYVVGVLGDSRLTEFSA